MYPLCERKDMYEVVISINDDKLAVGIRRL